MHGSSRHGTANASARILLIATVATVCFAGACFADWLNDAKQAAISYADDKKNKLVKDQAKAAVFSLYKKLYSSKLKANPAFSRALAEVAISAPELNKLAEETAEAYASGDPNTIAKASQNVAVKFGQQMSRLASNPETRAQLGAIIGSADKVEEVSQVLGKVAAGTDEGRRAAEEYVGQALINMTPGAGVINFYQSAYGAMKYANNEYVDSKLEQLYKAYKDGDAHTRELLLDQLRAGTGGYGYVIENRRKELEQEKSSAIGDAARSASERVLEHVKRTTQDEIIRNVFASFDGRIEKERKDAGQKAEIDRARKEAETILTELDWTAKGRYGGDWYEKMPINLDKYTSIVRDHLKGDGVLDPNNPLHVKLMSKAASTALIHGVKSKEYAKVLAELEAAEKSMIETSKGAPCLDGSPTQALASRLWQKGTQLAKAGKISTALPLLKQSLEFCPDDEHAAQLATLSKAPTVTAQAYDGSYVGKLTFTTRDWKRPLTLTGSITLNIKNNVVTGVVSSREPGRDGHADIVRKADISGRVSSDGRITATIKGKSTQTYRTDPDHSHGPAQVTKTFSNVISQLMMNYSFAGSFIGEISDDQGAGKVSATRLGDKPPWPSPNYVVGTWNMSRK